MMCGAFYALTTSHSHDQFTMGCQFEYTGGKELDRVDVAIGFICQEHREIITSELGECVFADVELLFGFSWLGKPEDQDSVYAKMRRTFKCDLRKDSDYRKGLFGRIETNLTRSEVMRELAKGIVH